MMKVRWLPFKKSPLPRSNVSDASSTTSAAATAVTTHRLYQVWRGRNRFLCGGRLIFGPDASSIVLTVSLIMTPLALFVVFVSFHLAALIGKPLGQAVPAIAIAVGAFVRRDRAGADVGARPRDHPAEPAAAGARGRRRVVASVRRRRRRRRVAPADARRVRERRGGEGEILPHLPPLPPPSLLPLLRLQQLRRALRPPLPLGRPVHRQEELQVLLHVHIVDDVPVPVRVRLLLGEPGDDREAVQLQHGPRRRGVAGIGFPHRVHVRDGVVRRRPHRVPLLPRLHQPDDVRELPVQVRAEGEPAQPWRGEERRRDLPVADPGEQERLQGEGRRRALLRRRRRGGVGAVLLLVLDWPALVGVQGGQLQHAGQPQLRHGQGKLRPRRRRGRLLRQADQRRRLLQLIRLRRHIRRRAAAAAALHLRRRRRPRRRREDKRQEGGRRPDGVRALRRSSRRRRRPASREGVRGRVTRRRRRRRRLHGRWRHFLGSLMQRS